VYGNVLIGVTSFISIALNCKVNRNWLAIFYGIGLGLVLDEFPLWMGDLSQLNAYVVIIPYSLQIVAVVCAILAITITLDRKKKDKADE
jgi:hypothetical protein